MIKVLGISGSPRRGGNSEYLLDKALEGAENKGAVIEKIVLNELDFVPCQECENLLNNGQCKVLDDMSGVYAAVDKADAIILASPVFFGSVSAQTKMMIDRFQCLWRAKKLLKTMADKRDKKGAFICVASSDRADFFDNSRMVVRNFFATIGAKYAFDGIYPGLENKNDASAHDIYGREAYILGRKIAE